MYELNNSGVININGNNGKYDNLMIDSSVKYGRNAADNYYKSMPSPITKETFDAPPILDFGLNEKAVDKNVQKMDEYVNKNDAYLRSLPPLEFEYRYMPSMSNENKVDKNALYGAAFEDLGGKNKVQVGELAKMTGLDKNSAIGSLDLNKDGYVDTSEYSTTILAADMMSKESPNIDKIDGTINSKGLQTLLNYMQKSNAEAATKLYSSIYDKYNLGNVNNL